MRICFITVGDIARLTGGYLYHREVFARLRASGASIDEIVASQADLPAQLAATDLGARVDLRRYDVLLVDALARAAVAPWLDAWRARRPLVTMVHELPSVAAGLQDEQELAWEAPLLRSDWLIAVSRHGAGILTGRGVPHERIMVASGGYDRLSEWDVRPLGGGARRGEASPVKHAVDFSIGAETQGAVRAICVAQWIPRKGIAALARAWGRAARPGDLLELIGEASADPVYAKEVREAAAGAHGRVVARGAVGDAALAAAYAGADLFALPTHYEGYGMAMAEALAHGLPVVSCAVGPIPELVGPDAGILVSPDDQRALEGALAQIIGDARLRERMSAAARRRAAALPTWDDTSDKVANALGAAILGRMR